MTTTELLHPRFEGVPLRFNRNHFAAELGFPPSPNPDPWPPVPQPPEPRLPPERKDPTLPDPDPEPDLPGLPEPARAHSPHSLAHFKRKYFNICMLFYRREHAQAGLYKVFPHERR